jgi:hypothetical protein
MMLCEECGLPLTVCNTLAAYRKAVEYLAKGNNEAAANFLDDAKDYYAQYRAERDAMDERPMRSNLGPGET